MKEKLFRGFCLTLLCFALFSLCALLISVGWTGLGRIDGQFLSSYSSRSPERAGILASLVGTIYIMLLTALISFPVGVGAALYLEEYRSSGRPNLLLRLIEVNLANLASLPSIIYGLLGLAIFVRGMQLGRSLIAGALTLSLLILPIIIIASRKSLRSVPSSIREASLALGATRWQTIRHQVLPMALPGIMTGTVLALSRAIGETAPLVALGAVSYLAFLPSSLLDPFTALPIQIFNWVSRPQEGFHVNAAAAICILLPLLLVMNGTAIYYRHKFQSRQ